MKSAAYLITALLCFAACNSNKDKNDNAATFAYCHSEHGTCASSCTVTPEPGQRVRAGSYVKVYLDGNLLTEGYILEHVSGRTFILKDKKEASDPAVCGGCCGPHYEIRLDKKQVWGC